MRSMARSSSSPPTSNRWSNPPASRNAARRTTAAQATKPPRQGPGTPSGRGRGLAAMVVQTGSNRSSCPRRTRAQSRPTQGWSSSRVVALARDPGAHHESSSLNATYGVTACAPPAWRAAAPWLRPASSTTASGASARTRSGVPSVEPLSTTMTAGRSGSVARRAAVLAASSARSRVIITTETRPGDTISSSGFLRWASGCRRSAQLVGLLQQGASTSVASLEAPEQLLGVVDQFLGVRPGDPRAQARPGAGHPAGWHLQRDAHHRSPDVVLPGDRPTLLLQPSHERGGQFDSGHTGFERKIVAMLIRHHAQYYPRVAGCRQEIELVLPVCALQDPYLQGVERQHRGGSDAEQDRSEATAVSPWRRAFRRSDSSARPGN